MYKTHSQVIEKQISKTFYSFSVMLIQLKIYCVRLLCVVLPLVE